MRSERRLAPYILLNIFVSVLTTLLVLWIWDLTHPRGASPVAQLPIIATSAAMSTLPSTEEPLVEIQNVFGVGIAESESVRIARLGSGDLWMTSWELSDQDGNVYGFPRLNFVGGIIDVYTRPGVDAPTALHWKLDRPVWRIGETVTLKDPDGNIRAQYLIR